MDRKAERNNRYNYWQQLVDEQEKSGLSQVVFCQQKQLVLSQFCYYRSIFKAKKIIPSNHSELFKSIQFKPTLDSVTTDFKIVLPNGLHCFFPANAAAQQIKNVLEVLLSC